MNVNKCSRRDFISTSTAIAASISLGSCTSPQRHTATSLQLEFFTIKDPDGWHPSLRLKGDWLIFKISDGHFSGYGEASHSKQDKKCQEVAKELFEKHFSNFDLSLESLAKLESTLLETRPDFVTATAWSGMNQALYDLLAKREQVPVWRLFSDTTKLEKIPLYTTINRSLKQRSIEEYLDLTDKLVSQGFTVLKCAPFEKVRGPDNVIENSQPGLRTLEAIRKHYPEVGIRVDFHERFSPEDFFRLLPDLESISLDWLEEPFGMGDHYHRLQKLTATTLAGGELFWGTERFQEIIEQQWVDVIMPDVKHVGGFGPLLKVIERGTGHIEVSPHNPSGPISTAASLHAAAIYPEAVKSLEFAFDRENMREQTGERVAGGFLYLNDSPGWGLDGVESFSG